MAEHGGGGHGGGEGGVMRELLAVFGFGVDTHELKKGEGGVEEFVERVKGLAKGLAAAFVAVEINEWAEQNVKAMSEIEHQAARLGISTEQVQQYQYAAKALGLESQSLLNMMGRMQVAQEASAQGTEQTGKGFGLLGVKVKDASGKMKDADTLFTDVADSISKIEDPAKRAAAVTQIFGRSGREMLPLLNDGPEGLAKLKEEFKELGGGYTEEAIEASKEYEHQSAKLNLTLNTFKSKILTPLLPVLAKIMEGVMHVVHSFGELIKNSHLVQGVLIVLGAMATAFAIQMAIANAPLLLLAGSLALIAGAVDDVITFMRGGDSIIGRTIDKLMGKGAHVEVVKEIKDEWNHIVQAMKDLWDAVQPVWEFFKFLVEKGAGALKAIAEYSGKFGDAMAQLDNKVFEKFGIGGHMQKEAAVAGAHRGTFEENTIGHQAQRFIASKKTGAAFHPTEVPASYKGREADFMKEIEFAAKGIETGDPRFKAFAPPNLSPGKPSIAAPAQNTATHVNITQNIHAAPGMDERQLGEHAAKRTGEVLKQERRAAAATFQRKAAAQ